MTRSKGARKRHWATIMSKPSIFDTEEFKRKEAKVKADREEEIRRRVNFMQRRREEIEKNQALRIERQKTAQYIKSKQHSESKILAMPTCLTSNTVEYLIEKQTTSHIEINAIGDYSCKNNIALKDITNLNNTTSSFHTTVKNSYGYDKENVTVETKGKIAVVDAYNIDTQILLLLLSYC